MNYKDKFITVEEALDMIKDNDMIVAGVGACEPQAILEKLHTIEPRIKNKVTVTNCLPIINAEFFTNPKYSDKFFVDGWFYSGSLRKAHKNGNISYIPNHLHLAGEMRLDHVKTNVYIGAATPIDKHGYVSLGVSNIYEKKMIENADLVILEINPKMPYTYGDVELHVSDIDYMIDVNYDLGEIPDLEPNELDFKIGAHVAKYINDGDCIQFGIGGIPNAVAASLMDKKDLGVHTEMLTTGLMKLAKAGVVNGKAKSLHKNKIVCTFALGTRELYDFCDQNPSVLFLDGFYVNDPYVVGLNDNQVSINTSIEVDLTGQCASESIGSRHFSGTGGQADTAIGAQRAKNGRSFITLYSTAWVTNKETGEKEQISKIVPQLKPGAAVTLHRSDVDFVVTEYGAVRLRGMNIRERVEALISIAHPKFREQLKQDAIKLGIIAK